MPTYKFSFEKSVILLEADNMIDAMLFMQPIIQAEGRYKFDFYNPKKVISQSALESPLRVIEKKSKSQQNAG